MAGVLHTTSESIIYGLIFILLYFQVFLLLTFLEKRKSIGVIPKLPDTLPSVTVIVPCFNEETTLDRTVTSLLSLDYPKDLLSIFLIDDGSTDTTHTIMNAYAQGFPQIHVFSKPNSGKWQTLNFGLDRVTSDLVGCLDADSFVDAQALKEIVARFAMDPKTMAVTPSIRIWKPNTLMRMMQNAEYDLGTFMRKTLSFLGAVHITPGPFSIFKREVFNIVGQYRHAHSTEDFEIALRMQKARMKIDNAERAVVFTVGPATAKALYKQRVRWTGGFLQNLIDYRDMLFSGQYGVLGAFILPMTVVSVWSSLYFISSAVYGFSMQSYERFESLRLVNYNVIIKPFSFSWHPNWFFVNTEAINFVGFALVGSVILFISIGRKLANDNKILSLDLLCFVVLYSFVSPFWLLKSVYNTALSKEAKWR